MHRANVELRLADLKKQQELTLMNYQRLAGAVAVLEGLLTEWTEESKEVADVESSGAV